MQVAGCQIQCNPPEVGAECHKEGWFCGKQGVPVTAQDVAKVYMHSSGCVAIYHKIECISVGASAGATITTLYTGRCARDVHQIMDRSLM